MPVKKIIELMLTKTPMQSALYAILKEMTVT